MPKFTVKTKFIFTGEFYIEAEDAKQAREYVERHCGMTTTRGIHSSLDEESVDWNFPVHPDKKIGKINKGLSRLNPFIGELP